MFSVVLRCSQLFPEGQGYLSQGSLRSLLHFQGALHRPKGPHQHYRLWETRDTTLALLLTPERTHVSLKRTLQSRVHHVSGAQKPGGVRHQSPAYDECWSVKDLSGHCHTSRGALTGQGDSTSTTDRWRLRPPLPARLLTPKRTLQPRVHHVSGAQKPERVRPTCPQQTIGADQSMKRCRSEGQA